jgi:hypothetical protein
MQPVSSMKPSNIPTVAATTLPTSGVMTRSDNTRNVRQRTSNYLASDSHGFSVGFISNFSVLFEAMSKITRVLMQRPIREILKDYDVSMIALKKARSDHDEQRVLFYDTACQSY